MSLHQIQWILLISTALSSCALIICVFFLPQFYKIVNELSDEVDERVAYFRVETDLAWDELIGIQLRLSRSVFFV
jgi:hypothetical protein